MSDWGETKIEAIALVASAGGVGALSAVLRGLPADLAAAVVVQQHLSVNGSSLTSVLARRTGLDVVWADDGCRPMPGQVTVCPPRTRMEILPDGSCSLLPNESGAWEYPHHGLLTSLADSCGPRAMAVVLAGMGRDGAAGAAAVKAAGGLVIAQSEDTAEHPQMPPAAAVAGAHLRLPLPEIGPVIADVISGRPLRPLPSAVMPAL
jgi:chemotaxis response regulator CheB